MEQSALEKPIKPREAFSPSNFDATNGAAQEWNLNSTGYLTNTWVTNGNGARPDSYYDRK